MLQSLSRKPGRVLMTIDAVGGIWRYAMDLGAALTAGGTGVVFAGLGPAPSPAQRQEAESIGDLAWLDAPLDWMASDESELDGLPAQVEALVHRHAVDLVHLNLPSQAYGLRVSCPVVVVSHSCVVTWFRAVRGEEVQADWAWQKHRNRAGFDAADATIAPSRSHAELLRACYGPISNLRVVHNAARPASAQSHREDFVFAAGRWWDEGKNAAVLDAAARDLSWPLLVAGPNSGPSGQRAAFEHAQALGELPNAQVRDLMARAGIVVSPSLYEPFGLAALEAASGGAALVLADIPTYRELWDGAALFADPRRPAAFTMATNALAADARRRAEMGRLARRRAQRFPLAAQTSAILQIYASALADAGSLPLAVGAP